MVNYVTGLNGIALKACRPKQTPEAESREWQTKSEDSQSSTAVEITINLNLKDKYEHL